ncbi:golgin subfamily A member 1-like [Artemia franciscana]|uniref:GRIP domain-containing protein n=1 Tax=Artemia franciscana TaxID=6661 RepID=A0AA88I694_ARTSF|nr:hypothetical protein QYM36_002959 [Artemia franciscana]
MFKKLKEKIEETSGEDLRNAATSFMPPIPALKKDTRASQGSIAHGSQKSLASISASMTSISDQTIVQDLSSNQTKGETKLGNADQKAVFEEKESQCSFPNEKCDLMEQLIDEVNELKQALKDKDTSIHALSDANKTLEIKLLEVSDSLKVKNNELIFYMDELEKLNNRNVALEHEKLLSSSATELLENSKKTIEEDLHHLRESNNKLSDLNGYLVKKVSSLEAEVEELSQKVMSSRNFVDVENSDSYKIIVSQVNSLKEEVEEKNKNIKYLQQLLSGVRKELQKQIKVPDVKEITIVPDCVSAPEATQLIDANKEDVNFQYLKNVIFKFLTSDDYEGKHLVRAVSTLLKLTKAEEKFLLEMLEWRNSWFRSRPNLPKGENL